MTADRPGKGRSPARFWIAAGLVLLLAGALLTGRNLLEQYRASRWSSQLLTYVEGQISAPPGDEEEPVPTREPIEEEDPWASYEVDGILSIPDLGLRLPVLSHYEEELLSVSPCLYKGTGGDDPSRLVVAGHNYRSHFGRLGELTAGSLVSYQSLSGVVTQYQVTGLEEIDPEGEQDLMEGEWDITLLTCNLDMSMRLLVRCSRL